MAKLDVWNQALTLARARGRLISLTDPGPEQEVLAQVYPFVLKTVQSAVWWPGCKAQSRLALLTTAAEEWTDEQPDTEYGFAYAVPTNMLRPWHLTRYERFSFSYNLGESRNMISTDAESPILTYAILQEAVEKWSPLQENATVMALAAMITGPLTGKNTLARQNYELANQALMEAQSASANDLGAETKPNVPWLQARGYGRVEATRYHYPTGELFSYAK